MAHITVCVNYSDIRCTLLYIARIPYSEIWINSYPVLFNSKLYLLDKYIKFEFKFKKSFISIITWQK